MALFFRFSALFLSGLLITGCLSSGGGGSDLDPIPNHGEAAQFTLDSEPLNPIEPVAINSHAHVLLLMPSSLYDISNATFHRLLTPAPIYLGGKEACNLDGRTGVQNLFNGTRNRVFFEGYWPYAAWNRTFEITLTDYDHCTNPGSIAHGRSIIGFKQVSDREGHYVGFHRYGENTHSDDEMHGFDAISFSGLPHSNIEGPYHSESIFPGGTRLAVKTNDDTDHFIIRFHGSELLSQNPSIPNSPYWSGIPFSHHWDMDDITDNYYWHVGVLHTYQLTRRTLPSSHVGNVGQGALQSGDENYDYHYEILGSQSTYQLGDSYGERLDYYYIAEPDPNHLGDDPHTRVTETYEGYFGQIDLSRIEDYPSGGVWVETLTPLVTQPWPDDDHRLDLILPRQVHSGRLELTDKDGQVAVVEFDSENKQFHVDFDGTSQTFTYEAARQLIIEAYSLPGL